jgi:signal transduction histidine kinase
MSSLEQFKSFVSRTENSKLLIVDDRKENLLALTTVLGEDGYELFEALSGAEALEKSENHEFVAILMDVQMPIMNGFDAAKFIRKSKLNSATPIIFVTAIHRNEMYAQEAYQLGAVDYLFKPINVDILKAKISVFAKLYQHQKEMHKQATLINERAARERENELLKESLQVRDQFLSMASHELKTPITPLTLQMQIFLKMMEDGSFKTADVGRLQRMVQTSYQQVERLGKTIDNLLDVSRFTSGQMQLNCEKIDLAELITRVLRNFEAQFVAVGCECLCEVKNEVRGYWDPFRVEQIFINLISNAMKYGAGKPIKVTVQGKDGYAQFQVRDHGIGIDPADQERIFRRFERAVSADFYNGIGLGLFIAHEIVRMHQGSIHVDSALGQGATFSVSLPLS